MEWSFYMGDTEGDYNACHFIVLWFYLCRIRIRKGWRSRKKKIQDIRDLKRFLFPHMMKFSQKHIVLLLERSFHEKPSAFWRQIAPATEIRKASYFSYSMQILSWQYYKFHIFLSCIINFFPLKVECRDFEKERKFFFLLKGGGKAVFLLQVFIKMIYWFYSMENKEKYFILNTNFYF